MSDRVIVITGGYGKLGRCFARAFVAAGDQVVLTGRDSDQLVAASQELGCADQRPLDVTDRTQITDLARHLETTYGHVDVLINNAAKLGAWGALADVDPDEVAQMLQTNIHGPFVLTQTLLPLLQAADAPLIVNVASTSGHRADAQTAAYNASKFGLLGFTEAIRKDLRQQGIRVTSLSPSGIDFQDDAPRGGNGARLHGDDIAAAARWLADAPPRTMVRDIEMWATNP